MDELVCNSCEAEVDYVEINVTFDIKGVPGYGNAYVRNGVLDEDSIEVEDYEYYDGDHGDYQVELVRCPDCGNEGESIADVFGTPKQYVYKAIGSSTLLEVEEYKLFQFDDDATAYEVYHRASGTTYYHDAKKNLNAQPIPDAVAKHVPVTLVEKIEAIGGDSSPPEEEVRIDSYIQV